MIATLNGFQFLLELPQGTKLGPWIFLIMINDLDATGVDLWKYVDDTTISEVVGKGHACKIQAVVDNPTSQSRADGVQLNESKCTELRISFAKKQPTLHPVEVNANPLEVVTSAKILELNVTSDLKWNFYI